MKNTMTSAEIGYIAKWGDEQGIDVDLFNKKQWLSKDFVDKCISELREKISELEHEQWQYWSETIWRSDFHNIRRDLDEAMDVNSAIRIINERKERWQKNWIPYFQLDEKTKDFDRKWADKIISLVKQKLEQQ